MFSVTVIFPHCLGNGLLVFLLYIVSVICHVLKIQFLYLLGVLVALFFLLCDPLLCIYFGFFSCLLVFLDVLFSSCDLSVCFVFVSFVYCMFSCFFMYFRLFSLFSVICLCLNLGEKGAILTQHTFCEPPEGKI